MAMEAMTPKYAYRHGMQAGGYPIPLGCVYMRMNACEKNGVFYPRMYAWVEDTLTARSKDHFYVTTLRDGDKFPRRTYMDCTKGWAKHLKKFIDAMDEKKLCKCKPEVYLRDIHRLDVPRDRQIGQYIQSPRRCDALNSVRTTDYSPKGDFSGIVPVITKSTRRTVPSMGMNTPGDSRPAKK